MTPQQAIQIIETGTVPLHLVQAIAVLLEHVMDLEDDVKQLSLLVYQPEDAT